MDAHDIVVDIYRHAKKIMHGGTVMQPDYVGKQEACISGAWLGSRRRACRGSTRVRVRCVTLADATPETGSVEGDCQEVEFEFDCIVHNGGLSGPIRCS
jgi:hypothetical protein